MKTITIKTVNKISTKDNLVFFIVNLPENVPFLNSLFEIMSLYVKMKVFLFPH